MLATISRPNLYLINRAASSQTEKAQQPAPKEDAPPPDLEDRLDEAIARAIPQIEGALKPVHDLTKDVDLTLRDNKEVSQTLGDFSQGVHMMGSSVHPFKNHKEMVEAWLGATEFHRFTDSRNPAPLLPGLRMKAVQDLVNSDKYTVVHTTAPPDWRGQAQAPKFTSIRTDYETTEKVPLDIIYLLEDEDHNHIMVQMNGGRLSVVAHNDQRELVDEFYETLDTEIKENNFYKNKILQFNGYLDFQDGLKKTPVTWDDIALPEISEQLIRSNTVDFLENLDAYKKNVKFPNRNLLMAGPPGTGKSMVNDILMQQLEGEATFIHVTSKSLTGPGAVAGIFDAAREMQPAVVILEDLDMLGATGRDDNTRRSSLNEMLNQLSGVFDNTGLVVIGSTNAASQFDHAMLRPLRFSNVIPMPLPDAEVRANILEKITRKLNLAADVDLAALAARTEEFTGAGLTELKEMAVQSAIEGGSFHEGNKVLLRNEDFEKGLEIIRLKKEYLEQIKRDEREQPPEN